MDKESRTEYVKRCIRQETQELLTYPITSIPRACLTDKKGECYFSSPCTDDEKNCVEVGNPTFEETIGDWSLVDTCENKNLAGFSSLAPHLKSLGL